MSVPPQLVPTGFSLAAALSWGISDFTGGFASKRSDAFLITLLAHTSGFVLMTTLSLATQASFPSRASEGWALAAGALGGSALAIFYRALASGKMGVAAPLAAVLAAAIPTAFAIMTEGTPGAVPLIGFLLASGGIWLMARPDGSAGRQEGLSLALIAGLGFAGFFLCIHQTRNSSALWSSAHARLGSLVVVAWIVMARGGKTMLRPSDRLLALLAGCLDSVGTVFFIRAQQMGRLDAAVVLSSLYPAVTVLLAGLVLKEHFTRWKTIGIVAALAAVPIIAVH